MQASHNEVISIVSEFLGEFSVTRVISRFGIIRAARCVLRTFRDLQSDCGALIGLMTRCISISPRQRCFNGGADPKGVVAWQQMLSVPANICQRHGRHTYKYLQTLIRMGSFSREPTSSAPSIIVSIHTKAPLDAGVELVDRSTKPLQLTYGGIPELEGSSASARRAG